MSTSDAVLRRGEHIRLTLHAHVPLTAPAPIPGSKVSVTIDGVPASVGYAGAIAPGLYQVNVTMPAVQHTGDVPVRLTIGSKSTQPDMKLTVAS